MEQIKKETKKRALQRIDTLIKTFKELQRRVESEDYEGTTILMLESQRYIGLVLGEVRNLITIKQNQKTDSVIDYKKGR